mgnify:CR=1 FL=1
MRRVVAIDTARLTAATVSPQRSRRALHRLWTDPDVRRYLWDDQVIDRQLAEATMQASIDCTADHGFGHWAVCPSGSDTLIGFCGAKFMEDTTEVELLYGLAPAYWKQGLATEAAHAMLRFGFEELNFARMYAITDAPNSASMAVMQRLGMRFEKRYVLHGLDSVRYVIARADYRPAAGPYALRRQRSGNDASDSFLDQAGIGLGTERR